MALGGGGLLLAGAAMATAVESVHRSETGAGRLSIAFVRVTYPRLNLAAALLIALGAAGAAAVGIALHGGWREGRAYRRLRGRLAVVGRLERDPTVTVIADAHPEAFCAGYLRPGVYVSEGTLALLRDDELGALLAHERHHRRVRDPLRLACTRILGRALFFVPALGPLRDRYAEVAELSADAAAVSASGGRRAPLAAVLHAFDRDAPPGTAGIAPERVDALLGETARPRLPLGLIGGSLAGLLGLGASVWFSSRVAVAWASFNLPLLSSRPCLAMLLAALPVAVWVRRLAR